MLQGKGVAITFGLAGRLDLNPVNPFARVDQAVIGGVIAERDGDIEALAQGTGEEELLAGSPYCFCSEDYSSQIVQTGGSTTAG